MHGTYPQVERLDIRSKEDLSSPVASQIFVDSKTDQFYNDSCVGKIVRQLVTPFITEQIFRGTSSLEMHSIQCAKYDSQTSAPELFKSKSIISSV